MDDFDRLLKGLLRRRNRLLRNNADLQAIKKAAPSSTSPVKRHLTPLQLRVRQPKLAPLK